MGTRRRDQHHRVTLWHESFHDVIVERAPPGIDVIGEFVLSRRPRRADLLLLRRKRVARRDREARILRALWPRLADATLIELESPSRGFRPSDRIRLVSYGMQYHAEHLTEVGTPAGLTLVLIDPALTRPLEDEIALMGWRLDPLGHGDAAIVGPWYIPTLSSPTTYPTPRTMTSFASSASTSYEPWRRTTGSRTGSRRDRACPT